MLRWQHCATSRSIDSLCLSLCHYTSLPLTAGADISTNNRALSALHDAARAVLDDALATDLPLLHAPAKLALAAILHALNQQQQSPPLIDGAVLLDKLFKDSTRYACTFTLCTVASKQRYFDCLRAHMLCCAV
jgi:hypothetical protein